MALVESRIAYPKNSLMDAGTIRVFESKDLEVEDATIEGLWFLQTDVQKLVGVTPTAVAYNRQPLNLHPKVGTTTVYGKKEGAYKSYRIPNAVLYGLADVLKLASHYDSNHPAISILRDMVPA